MTPRTPARGGSTPSVTHIHQRQRRDLMLALAAGAAGGLLAPLQAAAQAVQLPSRPIRIVLSNAAGTAPDVCARLLAQRLHEVLGGTFVVENKPGAGGQIAAETVAGAAADGTTLLFGTMAEMALTPHIYKSLRYDVKRDFVPIAEVGSADLALVVNPANVPTQSLADFITYAKTKQPLLAGTFGVGTPGHLAAAQFGDTGGLKVDPVHYRAAGDGVNGIVAGDIQILFASIALSAPFIKAGKLKALAVTATGRSPVLPDVPTVRELGFAPLEMNAWLGLFAPAKTAPALLDKLSDATQAALKAPEARRRLEDAGFRVTGKPRAEFAKMLDEDFERWGAAVRKYGVRAD